MCNCSLLGCIEMVAFPSVGLPLALAPMQEVTDCAFMETLRRLNCLPDFFVTPYFRSSRESRGLAEPLLRMIVENATGVPVRAQLLGADPEALARDAKELLKYSVSGIDLNAGCPAPRVCRKGAGAGLLLNMKRFETILKTLREVVPSGMFSVKCRLGWCGTDEWEDILPVLKKISPDLVTVHARTREGMYRSAVCREAVAQAVHCLDCPVFANGDIADAAMARLWLQATAPNGLMIGRGAVRNPYIFRILRGGAPPTYREMLVYTLVLMEETERFLEKTGEKAHCHRMKKYLVYLADDLPKEFGNRMRRAVTRRDMIQTLEEFLSSDEAFPALPPRGSLAFFG